MTVPKCTDCEYCEVPSGLNIHSGHCTAVPDPFSGKPLSVKVARLDSWGGFRFPCGYAGALWKQKTPSNP